MSSMAMFSSLYTNISIYIMLRTRTMHLAILAASMSNAAWTAALLVASSGTVVWPLGRFSRSKNGAGASSTTSSVVGTSLSAQA